MREMVIFNGMEEVVLVFAFVFVVILVLRVLRSYVRGVLYFYYMVYYGRGLLVLRMFFMFRFRGLLVGYVSVLVVRFVVGLGLFFSIVVYVVLRAVVVFGDFYGVSVYFLIVILYKKIVR